MPFIDAADGTRLYYAEWGAGTPVVLRSHLEAYEDASHGLFYTHRKQLNADLIAFVKSGSRQKVAS